MCSAVQCSAVQCIVQYCTATPPCAVQCSAVQCGLRHCWPPVWTHQCCVQPMCVSHRTTTTVLQCSQFAVYVQRSVATGAAGLRNSLHPPAATAPADPSHPRTPGLPLLHSLHHHPAQPLPLRASGHVPAAICCGGDSPPVTLWPGPGSGHTSRVMKFTRLYRFCNQGFGSEFLVSKNAVHQAVRSPLAQPILNHLHRS